VDAPQAKALLQAAAAEHAAGKLSYDQARAALADVIREVAPVLRQAQPRGWQTHIVETTGYTRERIRQIVEGK
jgi:hypothetical protein